jgi:hypothetical protein
MEAGILATQRERELGTSYRVVQEQAAPHTHDREEAKAWHTTRVSAVEQ